MPIHLPPLNRRRFLASALAAGAGLMCPRRLVAQEPPADPNHFLLLADVHIGPHRDAERHGLKPAEAFEQIRRDILGLAIRPTQAIFAGDCAMHDGQPGDYAMLGDLIDPLRQDGMSMHFALGNHDNRKNFLATFPGAKPGAADTKLPADKLVSVLETPHANWFLLDSLDKTLSTPGLFGEAQLTWLAQALDARPNKPALILAHHHINPPLVESKGIRDSSAFLDVLTARKHVKAYFYGHTHRWNVAKSANFCAVNLPTTVWLSNPSLPRGAVTAQLRPDGATLQLHSLDKQHAKHGEKVELQWST